MAWQPIDTAPKYVEVLVYAPGRATSVFTAQIVLDEWVRSNGGQPTPWDDFFGDGDLGVTLWMPLPDAP